MSIQEKYYKILVRDKIFMVTDNINKLEFAKKLLRVSPGKNGVEQIEISKEEHDYLSQKIKLAIENYKRRN